MSSQNKLSKHIKNWLCKEPSRKAKLEKSRFINVPIGYADPAMVVALENVTNSITKILVAIDLQKLTKKWVYTQSITRNITKLPMNDKFR